MPPTPPILLPDLAALLPRDFSVSAAAAKLGEKPTENTLLLLGAGAVLFYLAEKNHNDKVNDIFDALEYCSSSLSVGYTDVYPQTPVGKLVATAIMTFGPSLVSRVTTPPSPATPDPLQQQILATLEQILTELRTRQAAAGSAGEP